MSRDDSADGRPLAFLLTVWIQRPPLDPPGADGARGPVGDAVPPRAKAVSRYLDRRTTARRFSRAWDRSPTTCRKRRGTASVSIEFVHEGNGDLWTAALDAPRRHVSWVLIEERAEGGDSLAARARTIATFLTGFARAADGGGVVLYRRVP